MVDNLVLGYCCLNTELRKQKIFSSRTCRLKTIQEKGIEYSYELAMQNLKDTLRILEWNYRNDIYNFRLSSEIFPFATHPDYYKQYNIEQFQDILKQIGDYAKSKGMRLTFHPGQYNVLGSKNQKTVEKTIVELNFTANLLDLIGCDRDGIMIIHGGTCADGKLNSLQRFMDNYRLLSESAQQRLVIENCEMMYTIGDLLPLSRQLKIPIVVDSHHHLLNPGQSETFLELIEQVLEIWDEREIRPLFHISEMCEGITLQDTMLKKRKHSDYVTAIPQEYLEIAKTRKIWIDIEAKMKEQAVIVIRKLLKNEKILQK